MGFGRLLNAIVMAVVLATVQPVRSVSAAEATADLVLKGGAVYTVDGARSWAEAVAVSGGRIVYVGPDSGVEKLIGAGTRVFNLGGKMVLPGFQDCHVHPVMGAVERAGCDVSTCKSRQETIEAIRNYALSHPDKKWIAGAGWRYPFFPNSTAVKEDLDRAVSDRPACLVSEDGHSVWCNSRALEIAGIDKNTKDPPHGLIERKAGSGEPSGTLRENASALVTKCMPKPDLKFRLDALRRIQSQLHECGITAVQDAWVEPDTLDTYAALDRMGELTLKVVTALLVQPEKDDSQVKELVRRRDSVMDCRNVRATAVKIFADGVIESRTAAMLEPYLDRGVEAGFLIYEPDRMARLATLLDREGFQIHIHAIGDKAVHVALNSLAKAMTENGRQDRRHHMAHLQVIQPQDRLRFRQLGVIATFQPLWCQADDYMVQTTEPCLGPVRSKLQYPLASLIRSGAVVAAGSDWPVSSFKPLEAIEVAITHRQPDDANAPIWNPDERVDLKDILAAYTINAAYLNHREKETGSIEVGKAADIIVLDRNLFELPAERIHSAQVLMTLANGKPVYQAPSFK